MLTKNMDMLTMAGIRLNKKTVKILNDVKEKLKFKNMSETLQYLAVMNQYDVVDDCIKFNLEWIPRLDLFDSPDKIPEGRFIKEGFGGFDCIYATFDYDENCMEGCFDEKKAFKLNIRNSLKAILKQSKNYNYHVKRIIAVKDSHLKTITFYTYIPSSTKTDKKSILEEIQEIKRKITP